MTPQEIIQAVSDVTSVTIPEIMRLTRKRNNVETRQMCQYLINKLLPWKPEVERAKFWELDRTTLLSAYNAVQNRIDTESYWAYVYSAALKILGIEPRNRFTLQQEYPIEVECKEASISLNQDGSIICLTHENIRELYLSTL